LRAFYRELLRLRPELPALARLDNASLTATVIAPGVLELRRWCDASRIIAWMNVTADPAEVIVQPGVGIWRKQLDAAEPAWGGGGSTLPATLAAEITLVMPPHAVVVYAASPSAWPLHRTRAIP
jgi:maltooligosyltrehalose trehalohydrolase